MKQPPLRKLDLREHQLAAYEFAYSKPASLCCMGMGCGKTATALALADNWGAQHTLVLCPSTVRPVWRGQVAKHCARDMELAILDGGSVRKRTERADAACRSGRPAIIVINYEAAWREPFRSWCRGRRWDLAVLDESQRVMRKGKISQFTAQLREVSDRRLCLTGTPLTQDPMTVWAQCRFLDPRVFGDSLERFLARYENKYAMPCRKELARFGALMVSIGAADSPDEFKYPEWRLPSIRHKQEYLDRLATLAFRVENAVLNLPPITIEQYTFSLSKRSRRLYEAIQGGHLGEIETGRWPDMRGSYAITMRLQQITSGWLPDAAGNHIIVDAGKPQCLVDLLDEAGGEPVVVFARFSTDLSMIRAEAEAMGLRYGEISQRRKDGLSDIGTMPDDLQVVGVQEQAGGAGIDLTRARIAIDYSPSWSLQAYDQKIARIYRPPQSRPVIVYRLVAEDTVDEEIYRALEARREVVGMVWDEIEARTAC